MTLNEDFKAFFTSKDVDFDQAVQEPVYKTGTTLLFSVIFSMIVNMEKFLSNGVDRIDVTLLPNLSPFLNGFSLTEFMTGHHGCWYVVM